jgi:MFS family permease
MLVLFWRGLGSESAFELQSSGTNASASSSSMDIMEGLRNFRDYWSVWLVSFSWMVLIAARVASISFAPDYFLSVGYEYTYAGFLASLFTMGSLVVSPLTGYLIDKTGREEMYMIVMGIILAGLYLLLFATTHHLLLAALLGVAGAVGPVSIFAIVSRLLQAEKLGKGYGILRICENVGMLIGPFLAGLSYDFSGSYFYSFLLFAVLSLGSSAFAIILKLFLKKKDRETGRNPS